jgi:predicted ATPase/class 3 adenylate cyclase
VSELPTGTVTFLFTDVESSTRLWEHHPEAMRAALARHDELLTAAVETRGGHVIKGTGDGLHAVFAGADIAMAAAVEAQQTLRAEEWGSIGDLRVRMGLHTGVAEQRGEDYFGPVLNRAARVMSAGNGGQVLVSAATQELVRDGLPADCELLELGEYRLRDLGRPERIFQVVHPDLAREFPRLRTLDALPANLPVQVTSFVGRDQELARVVSALTRERVVTLTGVGGVGKTRLALHAAAEVLPRFRDGAWLCELQMVRDLTGVVDTVAGVFRVTARPGSTLEESLVAYLRDQQLLVVLDNCEHLLDGAAALVELLERSCPEVVVLATSREPLAIDGERVLGVRSLASAAADASLDEIAHADAVRLFVERAQAVKDDFSLTRVNASAVAQVCERLDGVPLAIELAAARVTAMNPGELARRLDRRFELLAGGRRRAIERHQTLRAAIDWSFELLSEPEQCLLARLAVFAGGCTLEATEAVCAGDPIEVGEVFELLASLVARSLVVADDTGRDTRYRLLETIRQYGEERLAGKDETDRLRLRHADYYTDFATVVQRHVYGPGQIEWAAQLAREHDNLLAAMAFALDTQGVDLAFRLFCQLPVLGVQVNEVVVFDPTSLLALPGAPEHPGSAVALMNAGFDAWRRGDAQLTLALCDQALAAEQRLGPTPGAHLGVASSVLRGNVAQAAGASDDAAGYYLDAARHAQAAEISALAAIYLGSAAQIVSYVDPSAARRHATEGLALARQTGMPLAIVWNLFGLAHAVAADDPDQARFLLAEALQLATALGYESPFELSSAVFCAARLQEWPTTLRFIGRVLHHHARSGTLPLYVLAAHLNLVAHGLAEHQPEPAAILQGAVGALIRRLAPDVAAPVGGRTSTPNDVAALVIEVRRNTTRFLTAALGEPRMRRLRAEGAAMNEDQACTYARAHIDEYLRQASQAVS